jgi:hypothetical protein
LKINGRFWNRNAGQAGLELKAFSGVEATANMACAMSVERIPPEPAPVATVFFLARDCVIIYNIKYE